MGQGLMTEALEEAMLEQKRVILEQGAKLEELLQTGTAGTLIMEAASGSPPTSTMPPALDAVESTTAAAPPSQPQLQPDLQPEPCPASPAIMSTSTTSFRDPRFLPPDEIVRDLIELFYRHIHPWAPILSPAPEIFHPPWSITVHAIVVVSLRLSTDSRLSVTKDQYHLDAKNHVLVHAIQSTSLESVQALALIALDLIGSGQGPSSWGLLGLLCRSAVHMGLAKEEDDVSPSAFERSAPVPSLRRPTLIPPARTWRDDEARRRLFWLIFCLDRYSCVSTGWEFALPSYDIQRRLPSKDVQWAGAVSDHPRAVAHQRTGSRHLASDRQAIVIRTADRQISRRWHVWSKRLICSAKRTCCMRKQWPRGTCALSRCAKT